MFKKNIKKRFRDFGFRPGFLQTGEKNTIADVGNILVGNLTKIEGKDIRTGITIIDPGVSNLLREKVPAAIDTGNGAGKLTGSVQVEELGTIEAPIALTNTLAVGKVARGLVDIVLEENPNIDPLQSINVVVGECNDGFVNNIHKDILDKNDVRKAYQLRSRDVAMGNVGAGTGTYSFSWKGGIGTSSRIVTIDNKKYTVGVLVQTNSGGALTVMGVPIGKILGKTDFEPFLQKTEEGSCMIVVATDAPLSARQLKRIARRALFGLARTGSIMRHTSGDSTIAFSTRREGIEGSGHIGICLKDDQIDPLFLATIEATEESIYNALFVAETITGRDGNTWETLPVLEVVSLLKKHLP
jgi:D-aminopeptidase